MYCNSKKIIPWDSFWLKLIRIGDHMFVKSLPWLSFRFWIEFNLCVWRLCEFGSGLPSLHLQKEPKLHLGNQLETEGTKIIPDRCSGLWREESSFMLNSLVNVHKLNNRFNFTRLNEHNLKEKAQIYINCMN